MDATNLQPTTCEQRQEPPESAGPLETEIREFSQTRRSVTKLDYRAIAAESKKLLKLAIPVMGSYILSFINVMLPLLTLGHLGTKYLAAISLTTMTANISGFSIGQGVATALDTLCSQAFTGSEDRHALGKHLQRSVVIMLALCIPITAIWIFTEPILIALGQDAEISRLSGVLILYLLPGLFPYLLFQCVQKYLQAQGIMQASFYITLLITPINVFLQFFFVRWTPLQSVGAPLATSITNILLPVGLIFYTIYVDGYQCWDKVDFREAFDWQKIKIFLKLGVPGVVMLCSEWWAFEIVALLAGLIGDEYLAAQSVMLNTASLCFMVPLGLSIAASTRVGNSLGANLPQTASNVAISAVILAFLLATLNATLLYSVKDVWGKLYSSDPVVIELVREVLPLVALFQINDGIGAVGNGILRGCGRQNLGAILNLSGYYILGLPLGVLFTFEFNFGLLGIWLGLTIGIAFVSILGFYIIVFRTDWIGQARKAIALVLSHASLPEPVPITENGEQP